VGVQRQYSGTIGKIANCQVAASLTIATRTEHVPVDFALYLPESWTEDPSRRAEAHIPDEVTFKTKPELGVEMIERAIADGCRLGWCWPTARMATTPSFAGACAARVWASRRLTPYDHGVAPGFAGTPNR